MCGIVGVGDFSGLPVDPSVIFSMTKSLEHRGPDGFDTWNHENFGFGHQRLSILDQSDAATQPMQSKCGNYILTFNGEIYNFRELQSRLADLGYTFTSTGDTEVLLYALIEWGTKTLDMLNGMFAFSFFNKKQKSLLLARDRYGVKPLYYSLFRNKFIFASEIKSILKHPSFEKKLNQFTVEEYFTFQNILTDNTFYENIHILKPGHYLKVDFQSSKILQIQYWDFEFQNNEENEKSFGNSADELSHLLEEAVKRQMISDVEVGSYLSGGIDSGAISLLANRSENNLKTFTCGFDLSSVSGFEQGMDERHAAEKISSLIGSEHYEVVLKSGDMERALPDVVSALEEPRIGQSYPNYYIAKLASKFVKVCLSGIGGDELFGGYPWRYFNSNEDLSQDVFISEYYSRWQRLLTNDERVKFFKPSRKSENKPDTFEIFKNVFPSNKPKILTKNEMLNMCFYFEAKTFLHSLLIVEDKLSMSHGLETRVPFLDNDIVEFAQKCPVGMKIKQPFEPMQLDENKISDKKRKRRDIGYHGKYILRQSIKDRMPSGLSESRKQGFSAPDATWFKKQSLHFVNDKLITSNAILYDFIDRRTVTDLVERHISGKENKRLLIWSLLSFEELLQNF